MCDILSIYIVVEDSLSEAVLLRLLGETPGEYAVTVLGRIGKNYINKKISNFNEAAKGIPFILLRDLDNWDCAPSLLERYLPVHKHKNLLFRVAVKEVEAWLMADRSGFSGFIGINSSRIPYDTETIENPKEFLIRLAKNSRFKTIREDIVPYNTTTAQQGRGYNSRLITFVNNRWNPDNAENHSDSLKRTRNALKHFPPEICIQ